MQMFLEHSHEREARIPVAEIYPYAQILLIDGYEKCCNDKNIHRQF